MYRSRYMYSASIYPYMCTHTEQKNCTLWQFHQGKHAYCVHVCVYVNI